MNQSLKDILADPQRRAAVLQVLPILVGALALYAAYFMYEKDPAPLPVFPAPLPFLRMFLTGRSPGT